MKKIKCFVTAVLLTGSLLTVEAAEPKETEQAKAAETAEDALFGQFETTLLDGEETDQDIFAQAELTMVNIWGTFCGPCIREMPDLGELAQEYAEKEVQLVGIISDVISGKDTADAETIVEYTGADYPQLLLSEDLYLNYLSQVQVVPTTVFVNRQGQQVGEVYTGSRSKEEWSEILDELLAEVQEEETE